MSDILSRAKEIYFDHLGSRFFMAREGLHQEYQSYEVSALQESEWRQELILEMSGSLNNYELSKLDNLTSIARYHGDSIILEAMVLYILSNLHTMDSYSQMIYANHIWGMASSASSELPGGPYRQARNMAIRMWQNILHDKIVIAAPSLMDINTGGSSIEEYLKQWANRQLTGAGIIVP